MTVQSRHAPDLKEIEQAEWRRRDSLSRTMCISVTIIIGIFAIKDVSIGSLTLALILSFFTIINILALIIYSRTKALDLFSYYLILSCGSLCLYLVGSGGTGDSGILWMASFPVLMFSILNVKQATISVLAMLFLASLMVYIPNNIFYTANYNPNIKIAGLGSFILIFSFTFYQARAREISAAAVSRLNRELSYIASTDELTQLFNRRDISLRLEFECRRSKRTGEEFSIILCDIDYFKKINDSFGHNVGDQALKAFSQLLQSRFRDTDILGRWGGEEFLTILPNTRLTEAIQLAEEVRKSICQASLFPNMPNRLVTMSAGIASSNQSLDTNEIIALADKELYKAKNSGRNKVMPAPKSPAPKSIVE